MSVDSRKRCPNRGAAVMLVPPGYEDLHRALLQPFRAIRWPAYERHVSRAPGKLPPFETPAAPPDRNGAGPRSLPKTPPLRGPKRGSILEIAAPAATALPCSGQRHAPGPPAPSHL